MTVEVRTRRLGLFVPVLLAGRAGATRMEEVSTPTASGNETAESAASSRAGEPTTPAMGNSRYTVCRNGVLMLSLPLSPEPDEKVIMRPTGFITLQSAGSQTKGDRHGDSNFLLSLCSARFRTEGISRRDTKQSCTFRSDQVLANDKAQNYDLRPHNVVTVLLRTNLPVVAGFTKAGI
jgi:hypothetical protein